MDSISGDRLNPELPELPDSSPESPISAHPPAESPSSSLEGAFSDSFELASGSGGSLPLGPAGPGPESPPGGEEASSQATPGLWRELDSSLAMARLHAEAPPTAQGQVAGPPGEVLLAKPIAAEALQAFAPPSEGTSAATAGQAAGGMGEPWLERNLLGEFGSLVDRLSAASSWQELGQASEQIFLRLGALGGPATELPSLLVPGLGSALPAGAAADLAGLTEGLAGFGTVQQVLNPLADMTPQLAQPLFGIIDAALAAGLAGAAAAAGPAAGTTLPPLPELGRPAATAASGTPREVIQLAFSRAESILTAGFQRADQILGQAEAQAKSLQETGLQTANQLREAAADEVRGIWEKAQQDMLQAVPEDRPAILATARQKAELTLSRSMSTSDSRYSESLAQSGQIIRDGQLQALDIRRRALDHSDLLNRFAWHETKLLDLRTASQEEVRESERSDGILSARQEAWRQACAKSSALVDHFGQLLDKGEPAKLRETALLIQGDRQALAEFNLSASPKARTEFLHHVQAALSSIDGMVKTELAAKYGCQPERVELLGSRLREGGMARVSGDRELTARIDGRDVPGATLQSAYDQVLLRLAGGSGRAGLEPRDLALRLGQKCTGQPELGLAAGGLQSAGGAAGSSGAALAEALARFAGQERAEQAHGAGGGDWVRLAKSGARVKPPEFESLLAEGFRQTVHTWDNQVSRRFEALRELGVQTEGGEPATVALPKAVQAAVEELRRCDREGVAPALVEKRVGELGTSAQEVAGQVEDLREGFRQVRSQLFQPR